MGVGEVRELVFVEGLIICDVIVRLSELIFVKILSRVDIKCFCCFSFIRV